MQSDEKSSWGAAKPSRVFLVSRVYVVQFLYTSEFTAGTNDRGPNAGMTKAHKGPDEIFKSRVAKGYPRRSVTSRHTHEAHTHVQPPTSHFWFFSCFLIIFIILSLTERLHLREAALYGSPYFYDFLSFLFYFSLADVQVSGGGGGHF